MGIPWVNDGEDDGDDDATHITLWVLKSQAAPRPPGGLGDGKAASARLGGHCSGPCLEASPLASATTSGEAAQVPTSIRDRARAALHPSRWPLGTLVRPSGKSETPLEMFFFDFPCTGGYFQGKVV